MKEFYCPNCKKKTRLNKFGACEQCGFIPPPSQKTSTGQRSEAPRRDAADVKTSVGSSSKLPMLKLRLKEAGYITDQVWTVKQAVLIGRHDPQKGKVDIDLTSYMGSEYISRQHAKIYPHYRRWYITDLKSSNGTFLNGKVLLEATPLNDGDVIAIGTLKFLVRLF